MCPALLGQVVQSEARSGFPPVFNRSVFAHEKMTPTFKLLARFLRYSEPLKRSRINSAILFITGKLPRRLLMAWAYGWNWTDFLSLRRNETDKT
jgi:hypothetical protein